MPPQALRKAAMVTIVLTVMLLTYDNGRNIARLGVYAYSLRHRHLQLLCTAHCIYQTLRHDSQLRAYAAGCGLSPQALRGAAR